MPQEGYSRAAAAAEELVLEDVKMDRLERASNPIWKAVASRGSELWLDTGDFDEAESLWCAEMRALTTNNTLLNKEVQKGQYDELVEIAAKKLRGMVPEEELPLEIAFILNARHALKLSRRFSAKVSVELHTDLAHDVERSVEYGVRYASIGPDCFYIKTPLTAAGVLAARRLGARGISVNFTLGFSARENYLIARIARPAFVNVFLGRLNAFVADNGLGDGGMVGEKATMASQEVVRQMRQARGLSTRQIAASMREGAQVATLAGIDVLTMPTKVAHGFEELGLAPDELAQRAYGEGEVGLDEGVDREALGINALWDTPPPFRDAVDALPEERLETMTPEGLTDFLAERGVGDVLPKWSDADVRTVAEDGKIPVHAHWKDRLADGSVGLDALMTLSGLHSFAADQADMDDRIRKRIG